MGLLIAVVICATLFLGAGESQSLCVERSRFQCGSGVCISIAKKCNGYRDCRGGEDELDCDGMDECKPRNESIARMNNYACKVECRPSLWLTGCKKRNKRCICDDECGESCVNPDSTCKQGPPEVPHATVQVKRMNPETRTMDVVNSGPPYQFQDVAEYDCERGRTLVGPFPRCSAKRTWSNEIPICVDFAKCGQAVNVGSIQHRFARAVGGENAADNAWPWQVLITRRSTTMAKSLKKISSHLIGGGSILNERWVLTAAHLFKTVDKGISSWEDEYVVFVGIFERPAQGYEVSKSVEAYSIALYHQHPDFIDEIKGNDIALIKLGNKLDENLEELDGQANGLTFGYYIRPVCLPCTRTCIKKKHLVDEENNLLVNDGMDFEAKCLVEENLYHTSRAKTVVTGFGHLNSTVEAIALHNFNPPKKLQQALQKILPKRKCRKGINGINEALRINAEFSETMMCCKSGNPDRTTNACQGSSGGPLVQEVMDDETGDSCWVQVGIVSWGYGCGQEYPGFYTNVARFIPWINQTIGGILPGV